ncbi:MAG: DUF1778 domain-containing protein [Pelagibaca sp.]
MVQMQEYIAPDGEAKSARKELKFQPSVLETIKRAARSVGMDPTAFITTAALERAKEIELAQYTTALPSEQFKAFAAAVDREGKQNDALASSIAKSRALFADD